MTNFIKKNIYNLILSLLMVFSLTFVSHSLTAYAAGNTKIAVSNTSPKVGEKITVNIEGSQSGDKMVIKFSNTLKLESSSANHTTNGNAVTVEGSKTTLTFTCVEAGGADIIASGSQNSASSVKVNISGGSDSNTENKENEETKPEKADAQFTIDGVGYVLSDKMDTTKLPANFKEKRVNAFDHDYRMASNGRLVICFMKKADDLSGAGDFFLYDEQSKEATNMVIIGNQKEYVIVSKPDSLPESRMSEKTLTIQGKSVDGYNLTDNGEAYEFFYGMDESGSFGWYKVTGADSYEAVTEGDISDLVSTKTTGTKTEKPKAEKTSFLSKVREFFVTLPDNPKHMLCILVPVFLVLLIVFVYTLISKKGKYEDDEDFEDEEDDDVISVDDVTSDNVKTSEVEEEEEEVEAEEAKEAEDSDEGTEVSQETMKLGFFARHKKEKAQEQEWKRLAEMDLDDFSSSLRESVKELEEEAKKAEPAEEKVPSREKKKIDFMDLNDL